MLPTEEPPQPSARIETWVAGLVRKSMLARYQADGRPFLAVGKWETRVRTKPKYPPPPDDVWEQAARNLLTNCGQVTDNDARRSWRLAQARAMRGRVWSLGLGKGASDNEVVFDAARRPLRGAGGSSFEAMDTGHLRPFLSRPNLARAAARIVADPKNAKSNYAQDYS